VTLLQLQSPIVAVETIHGCKRQADIRPSVRPEFERPQNKVYRALNYDGIGRCLSNDITAAKTRSATTQESDRKA